MSASYVINGRFRGRAPTGVQRVASTITARLTGHATVISPRRPLNGVVGHMWEQCVLPGLVGDRLLWSPCNTGPLLTENQVVTIHDAAVFDFPGSFSNSFREGYRLLLPKLAQRVRRVTTVSEFSRQRLSEHLKLDADRIDVIWNGVDSHFEPQPEEHVQTVTSALGLKPQEYFAALSTIEPRKNLQLTINAWQQARQRAGCGLDEMKLVVVGATGPAKIFGRHSTTAAAENIIFTGYLPEEQLPAVLAGARAVLFPSLYEGFGLPIVEAMACGTPTVVTRRGSLPEVAGDAALYVDAIDPSDLADAMIRLAHDDALRAGLSQKGLERAKLFSWDAAAAQYDAILSRFA
ncbi:MAG: glycosyltransferase family 1 protein [Caulobacteraceae bacterium]|nr:glycosyltransferase family 1 protein [Caulobacteraceae bacterium]